MTTLAEFMIVVGVGNRPSMLDKAMYNSWESRMLLYIKGKKNGRMMLESIKNEPLVYPTIEVYGQIQKKKCTELTEQEQLQDDCDVQSKNIVLQEHLLIHEIKLPFKMAGLLFNKCKGDRVRVLLVRELREMLQVQGETMQLVKQGLLSVIILDEEELAFLADPGITDCHDVQPTIIHNAAFQTDNLDAYDSDCDDISSAKAILIANLSSYGSDVLSEVLLADNKYLVNDNLKIDRLEQDNDHLCELPLSQDIVYICVNSFASRNDCHEMQQGFFYEYNENLILKVELTKKGQMVEKTIFDEVVLTCSRLKNRNVNLEPKL
nr:hypothetical protein [Tanacetum cinerariifolium]